MKAAVAARRWARWWRSGAPAHARQRIVMPERGPTRSLAVLLPVLAVTVLACAAIGFAVTQRDAGRYASERHAALQAALDELHPALDSSGRFAPGTLRSLEQRAGVADLRFDTDLAAGHDREVQSLHDAQGRIVGWFDWAPDRALVDAMDRLWSIVGAIGFLLVLGAMLAARTMRRLTTALARSQVNVSELAMRDTVTGLANRRAMLDRLDATMAARGSRSVAFALIDVDGFREVNDTLGRAGGDAMLVRIADRIAAAASAGAMVGRFDDDEFAVILASADAALVAALGDRLSAALAEPIFMDQTWRISIAVGIAQAPDDGAIGDELHRRAALALRAAKRSGRGAVRRFRAEIQAEHAERRYYLRELEAAIVNGSFDVHYQPIVAAEGGAMRGVEALLRWNHPTRGHIPPSLFIPLAEESGLMNRLGEIVLRRALTDAARWDDLFVSVNLSPVQMRHPGLVDLVGAALAETGTPAARVVLEVTEGILIDNPEETLVRLQALRALGVSTALDDFGSGYSSLSYLQKFPFDRLKIDRAFVASLGTTGNAGAIIQAIVTLGHALGMTVLAEGVETNEQRVLLRLAGCDEMQGFLFAKATTADAIEALATGRPAPRSGRGGTLAS